MDAIKYIFPDTCYYSLPVPAGNLEPTKNIGELTLLVNGMNNIITTYGIVLTILGIVIALISFVGYRNLLDKIKSKEKELNNLKDELEKTKTDYKNVIEDFKITKKHLDMHTMRLEQTNFYAFETLHTIADKMGQKELLIKLAIDQYKVGLFSTNEKERFASIMYLQENGKKEEVIPLLEHVSQHDPKEEHRRLAIMALGRIGARAVSPTSSQTSKKDFFLKSFLSFRNWILKKSMIVLKL